MKKAVFLFGEAEKGDFCTPVFCRSLPELADRLGHPPEDSLGIHFAVQTLLFERPLIFFRVREEGFCSEEYLKGVELLGSKAPGLAIAAIAMPGVGDRRIIQAVSPVCQQYHSCLIIQEKDLYDYLTESF